MWIEQLKLWALGIQMRNKEHKISQLEKIIQDNETKYLRLFKFNNRIPMLQRMGRRFIRKLIL